MSGDETQILLKKSLQGDSLTDDEADIVVSRAQLNTNAVERFEALELEIANIKKGARWLGALLLANYSSNILDWLTR
jgi:hypothetical protein